jgi:hypothetical protein
MCCSRETTDGMHGRIYIATSPTNPDSVGTKIWAIPRSGSLFMSGSKIGGETKSGLVRDFAAMLDEHEARVSNFRPDVSHQSKETDSVPAKSRTDHHRSPEIGILSEPYSSFTLGLGQPPT